MSPEAVTERLLKVSELREQRRAKQPPVDMSPEAITRRLQRVSELRDLCLELQALGALNGLT